MDVYDDDTELYLPEKVLLAERLEAVKAQMDEANRRYVRHICPVYTYFSNDERKWDGYAALEGSATAIECGGRYLLVTAEHVVRDEKHVQRGLALVMDGDLTPLPSVRLLTSNEPDDFAILELDQEQASHLTNVSFRKISEEPRRPATAISRQITFVGYPCSRNQVNYRSSTIPPLKAFSVWTTSVKRHSGGGTFHTHFSRETARYADGIRGCPDLHGISGGPVLEHCIDGSRVTSRLFGITVALDGEDMQGHELSYILAAWNASAGGQ